MMAQLATMERYERRVVSRRKFAIRDFDAGHGIPAPVGNQTAFWPNEPNGEKASTQDGLLRGREDFPADGVPRLCNSGPLVDNRSHENAHPRGSKGRLA